MLIVVAILALLAGILVPVLEDAARSSRDARRAADLKSVRSALAAYKAANGSYPSTGGEWWGDAPTFGGRAYSGATAYIPGLVPDWLPILPRDPSPAYPTADQGYAYRSDGVDYKFMAHKTPDNYPPSNPFYDPARPTEAWMVATAGAHVW
jgi:type II secretory pathway pseudopilin PulG